MGHKILTVLQECSVRWWSKLKMIVRILDIKKPLNAPLGMKGRPDLVLTDPEINKLQAIVNLMTKFEKFSTMLGGDKYVTMSYLKVMLIKIREHIQETTSDIQIIKDMKKTMRENLLLRYTTDEQKNMLDITSVLDPRFKNKHYNTSSTVRETLLLDAYYEATKPNIDEDDSQTQMPEESQSQVDVTQGQSLIQLSRNSIIQPRPCTSKVIDTQAFYNDIFGDEDTDPPVTLEEINNKDRIYDEITNYI